ncbi:MAG: hypothetical protein ACXAC5_05080 [Promethearchaeota archaeon]
MRLYLQYTSDIDKEHIKEASKLKNEEEAKSIGWNFIGSGCFKRAYKKGNVVVKFNATDGNNMHMLKELLLYKEANRKYKKHLARIFGGDGTRIIQRFVNFSKGYQFTEQDRKQMCEIASGLGIGDYCVGHNVVKNNNKQVIFYDFSGHCLRNV